MEDAAREFVRDPRNVRVDLEREVIHLSKIFKWFTEDFVGWLDEQGIPHPHGVLDFVVRYLPEEQRRSLMPDRLEIAWIEYDWSINAVETKRNAALSPAV